MIVTAAFQGLPREPDSPSQDFSQNGGLKTVVKEWGLPTDICSFINFLSFSSSLTYYITKDDLELLKLLAFTKCGSRYLV